MVDGIWKNRPLCNTRMSELIVARHNLQYKSHIHTTLKLCRHTTVYFNTSKSLPNINSLHKPKFTTATQIQKHQHHNTKHESTNNLSVWEVLNVKQMRISNIHVNESTQHQTRNETVAAIISINVDCSWSLFIFINDQWMCCLLEFRHTKLFTYKKFMQICQRCFTKIRSS